MKKPLKYSQIKNQEEPPKVLEVKPMEMEENLPESRSITPVKEFSRPIVSVEEAQAAFHQYQQLMAALMNDGDIVEIQGKKKIKKSGMNKIARFFGISVEIIKDKVEKVIGPMGGTIYVFKVWARGILPNGQFRVAGGACSSNERRFTHLWHDPWMMAETRAKKRVIEELAAIGELEAEEESEEEQDTEISPKTPPEGNQSDKTMNKKTIDRPTGQEGVKEVGIDPGRWTPLLKLNKFTKGVPTNNEMAASSQIKKWIANTLTNIEVDPLAVKFVLNNRADGVPRHKNLEELDKGDAFDVRETFQRKGKEGLSKLLEELPKEPKGDGSII